MATVLVLNPMGVDVTGFVSLPAGNAFALMRGELSAGNDVENVPYTNQPGISNINGGAVTLNNRLLLFAPGDKIIVFCYSEGCQVATRWLTVYGPTSSVSPDDIEFIFIGNANRKYGGFIRNHAAFAGLGDIVGAPADTEYKITDFTRQYDPVSDYPTAEPIQQALDDLTDVEASQSYLVDAMRNLSDVLTDQRYNYATWNAVLGAAAVHNFYFDVSLYDPKNVRLTEGNITYVWSPTYPAPLSGILTTPEADRTNRIWIEQAYERPVQIPYPYSPPGASVSSGPPPISGRDAYALAMAADRVAETKAQLNKDWIVKIYDKFWRPMGEMGDDMIELTGTDPRNALPTAVLKIKGGSDKVAMFEQCVNTMVGVTVETQGLRFAFYVDVFDYEFDGKSWTGTARLNGIYDILNYLQIWPNHVLPIQAQVPSHAVFIWALCTVLETMVAECSQRIQSGWLEFINNPLSLNFDMRTWFATFLQSNGNITTMLKTPLYVVRTDPLLDTSPLVAKTVRMESCGTVIAELTKAYGVDTRVDLWLPGDDQPDPWANLDQPTYVFTAKDRSQIEGPTKTVVDSVIRTTVDVAGSFFGNLPPLVQQVAGMEAVFEAPSLGVNFVPPWAVLVAPEPERGERGSISSCKISHHTPKGWQLIQGGRSPKWLNDLMNATYAWLIDSISILIGFTGIPSNLLEGFLNNAFLAFQLIQHYNRRNDVGPYHPAIEVFSATASSPYNIEAVFAFINMLWDTRGYVSAQATFRNGEVYTLGKDIFRGGLISILYRGRTRLLTEYVENIHFRITPTERDVMCQIGDGNAEEAPLSKHQRFITGLIESVNVLTLAPQS